MTVPTSIADLSTTAASNGPSGSEAPSVLDDHQRALGAILKQENSKGADIASSATITVPNAGKYFIVTGTTTINLIADSWTGRTFVLKFSGSLTLTHSSGLILPGAANITTAAGDCALLVNESTGVHRLVLFQPAAGYQSPLIAASQAEMEAGSESGIRSMSPLRVKQTVDSFSGSVQGAFKNLQLSAPGNSANITVTADEIVLESATNGYKTLRSVSLTVAGSSSGANGLDTGALAITTWYSVWVIWNGTDTSGLLSLSATAPTLPNGYTHKTRVGWIRTDATANKYPLTFKQYGKRVYYVPTAATNLTVCPQIAVGSTGTPGSSLTAAAIGAFAPSTATEMLIVAHVTNSSAVQVCSSNSPTSPGSSGGYFNAATSITCAIQYRLLYESTNIYWASSGASNAIHMQGWEDAL